MIFFAVKFRNELKRKLELKLTITTQICCLAKCKLFPIQLYSSYSNQNDASRHLVMVNIHQGC